MKHRHVGISRVGVTNPDGHTIGIDIGAGGVRAAVLSQGTVEGHPAVTAHGLGEVELPAGTVVDGIVVEPATITNALRELWAQHKLQCRNVIVGIANPQVLVRDLTMPSLDPRQLAKALPYQAKEVVALPIDDVVLDFCQLGIPDPQTGNVQGLLIATPREPVLAAVTAVEKAKLRVARVDLAGFGALRSVGSETPSVEAVIDLGAHLTTIVIHDRGVPRMVRTLTRAGNHVTDLLADRLSISFADAERLKRDHGLYSQQEEANRAMVEALRPLLAEIRTSIGYFRSTATGDIAQISLTGGGALLRGLGQAMTDQIGVPTRVIHPMQHIRNRLALRDGPQATSSAVALGLAMGAAA